MKPEKMTEMSGKGQLSAYLEEVLRKNGITPNDAVRMGIFSDADALATVNRLRKKPERRRQVKPLRPVPGTV